MLIKCPECELQASDKAIICPHCGYPFKPDVVEKGRKKSSKRKRLPNGFGQISRIKGRNLRKPFRAMVTTGKDSQGKPIIKPLKPESYFATYNEAYQALLEYNRNPYDLDDKLTVKELYERWTEEYFKTLNAESSIRTIQNAWLYCSSVYDMRAMDLRARHIKGVMENGTAEIKGEIKQASANMKARIKSLFNLMLDYALEYEIVDKNYARTFDISDDVIKEREESKRGHIPFTQDEIDKLWENIDRFEWVDVILFQCYSGWRPQELGLLELRNVDLENWTITGGMKTDAGKDRIAPVHTKVRHIVKKHYDKAISLGSDYLFNCTDTKTHRSSLKLTYDKYRQRHNNVRDALGLNPEHRAHDGRMHFVTQAKKWKVDEYAIKYIVGHEINDVTERVYTKRDIEWLHEEIEKIK